MFSVLSSMFLTPDRALYIYPILPSPFPPGGTSLQLKVQLSTCIFTIPHSLTLLAYGLVWVSLTSRTYYDTLGSQLG